MALGRTRSSSSGGGDSGRGTGTAVAAMNATAFEAGKKKPPPRQFIAENNINNRGPLVNDPMLESMWSINFSRSITVLRE